MRVCIKFGGNLMACLSGILSGGNLKEFCEWSVHPHEEGRARGQTPCAGHPLGVPPSSYKRSPLLTCLSHLLVKDLSPPLEFIPHGLGLARYMFPVAIR